MTGDLATARRAHTATLLPSGRVLIAGGAESGSLTTLASSELYDPAIGTFTRTGDLTAARFAHTATLLPSGHVLIAGGFNPAGGSNALASAEIYDAAGGTFTRIGDLTVARMGHTATLLQDGRVLIAGGIESRGTSLLASAELYDPASGTFTPTGHLSTPRVLHTATLLPDGRVLIVGGSDTTDGSGALASAELYDPASGTFTPTGHITVARFAHTATLLPDGRILIASGLLGGSPLGSAEIYDPANGTFTLTGFLTAGRVMDTATLLPDGQVLVAGGAEPGDRQFAAAELFQ